MDQGQITQFYKEIGIKIRDIRIQHNITQEELAKKINLSRPAIISIEKGRQKLYSHLLYEISRVLGVDIRLILPPSTKSFEETFEKLPEIYKRAIQKVLGNEWQMTPKKIIKNKVEELLIRFNCSSLPIDVEKIAHNLKIQIKYVTFDYKPISGVLIIKDNQKKIGVNIFQSSNRKRFTIAHELGHFILHDDNPIFVDEHYREKILNEGIDPNEIEANLFAVELLMPEHFIRNDIKNFETIDAVLVRELAKKYKVSFESLALRLNNLGYELDL